MCGVGFGIPAPPASPAIGGAVTGAAIGAMHYVGMAAVRAPADAIWDWRYVVASAVIGIGMMAYGMDFTVRRGTVKAFGRRPVIFTLAICSMHFTGMSASLSSTIRSVAYDDYAMLAPATLAIAIASVALLIVALGLIGAILDNHLRQLRSGEAQRLRDHVLELEEQDEAREQPRQPCGGAWKRPPSPTAPSRRFLPR